MANSIDIFMFIDACGWEVIRDRDFLTDLLPHRHRVGMQYGYSATAIPTILTGQPPEVHKHLSFYYYAPQTSCFKPFHFELLSFLPSRIFDRWRVRHIISRLLKKRLGFTGYFEIYAMPFNRLRYFDFIEKDDMFVPHGLAPTPNLADELVKRNIPHHISDWRLTEEQNVAALEAEAEKGGIRFAFLYTAAMDGLLHMDTKDGPRIKPKLDWYAEQVERIMAKARLNYDEVNLSIMSDHGMTTLTGTVDLKADIESLGLKFGRDYAAVYDSTMARFWFLNDTARERIMDRLAATPRARLLTAEDKKRYGIDFEDDMYGQQILLMDPGVQIEPCDMGLKALPGMHGFAPEHEDSYAVWLSTRSPEIEPRWVGDYFRLMVEAMDGIV